ncbi:MAG: two-component regulator propeller domain-containing protein, partial [Saprospiraceae bacterium]
MLLALLTALPLHGQAPTKPRFEHLSTDQGLPGRYVNVITQDSKGFIWVGTSYGLSRFDGYSFKNYQYDPIDSTAISSVQSLLEDKQGGLWIGTSGDGLKYFEVEHGKFTHYRHDENRPNSLSGNAISNIYEDAQGTLWISASGTGLNKLDREKGQIIHYEHSPGDTNSLSNNRINVIFEDSKHNFWVGTDAGLNLFDRQKETFSTIRIA